jgi:threonine/homoserine/homoserine lactone efflux protein
MTLAAWLSLFGICAMGAMSPGPSLAVVIRNTVRGSRWHGVATGLAHCTGVGFYALLTVSGLAALFAYEPLLQKLLTWGGAAYLAWLGVKALRSEGGIGGQETTTSTNGLYHAAREGLVIALLNPKLILFFLALFSQFVSTEMGWRASLIMVLTATIIDGTWYCLVAVTLSRRGALARLQQHALTIDRATGILLLIVALRVVTL